MTDNTWYDDTIDMGDYGYALLNTTDEGDHSLHFTDYLESALDVFDGEDERNVLFDEDGWLNPEVESIILEYVRGILPRPLRRGRGALRRRRSSHHVRCLLQGEHRTQYRLRRLLPGVCDPAQRNGGLPTVSVRTHSPRRVMKGPATAGLFHALIRERSANPPRPHMYQ